jgi:serine/threonine protein kinase
MRIVPPNQTDAGDPPVDDGRSAAVPVEVVPRPSLSLGTSHANLVNHVLADRYRLIKLIGEGGMGSVYQAEHITIGRKLAIKVLAPEYCDSPEVVARFLQEARTASMLHHEHIVDITDFGYTKQGLAFLTMEYLEGEDLATLLSREGRQPWARLRRIILQVCRALNAAHDKGIIHRDMKPDNCYRIKRGGNPDFIKILDFGIAKIIDGNLGNREDKPKMATEAGTLLGTPEYMAPEIARDQKADARVDIYSLGVLMYEMLTGSVPFRGQTFMATVAMQMVDDPVPPRERAPDASIPVEVEAVVMKALRKDPAERYQSIRELAEAIIDADKQLRMTSQGMPALRFESGEYAVTTGTAPATAGDHTTPPALHASGEQRPALGTSGVTARAGSTGTHGVVPAQDVEDSKVDEGSGMARPNPYRALSILLLLLVAGLGAAIYYLLNRPGQPEDGLPGDPAAVVDPALHPPTADSEGHDKPADKPADKPDKPGDKAGTGEPGDEPTKADKPVKKRDPPATLDVTKDDINDYISTLMADVTRCAINNNFARQKVTFLMEVEAGTGKVKANLESPLGNAAFASCAEKAIARKRFKKGRKYSTFHGIMGL